MITLLLWGLASGCSGESQPPGDPAVDTDLDVAVDADGDGFVSSEDCNDADPHVYPGAPQVCDAHRDNDCDPPPTIPDPYYEPVPDQTATFFGADGTVEDRSEDPTAPVTRDGALHLCADVVGGVQVSALDVTVQGFTTAPQPLPELAGASAGAVRLVTPGGRLVVRDLRIRGADAARGGGIRTPETGDNVLEILNVDITGSHATDRGGAVFAVGELLIEDSSLTNNGADGDGGGVYAEGTVTINRSTIADNNATSGGGLDLSSATSTLSGVALRDNAAYLYGSHLRQRGGSLSLSLSAATDAQQDWAEAGGALYLDGVDAELTEVALANNWVRFSGGALHAVDSDLRLTDVVFTQNQTVTYAGGGTGSLPDGRWGGAMSLVRTPARIEGSTFDGNVAPHGGEIFMSVDAADQAVELIDVLFLAPPSDDDHVEVFDEVTGTTAASFVGPTNATGSWLCTRSGCVEM